MANCGCSNYNPPNIIVTYKYVGNCNNCDCNDCECCHIGDGLGGIYYSGSGVDTCWNVQGNAHIFFSICTPTSVLVKGLGVIGQNDPLTISQRVSYNGRNIQFAGKVCPVQAALIRTDRIDCVSITGVGTRNTGAGQGWNHDPGIGVSFPPCDQLSPPNPGVGGQGAYTLNITNINPNGPFAVYLKLGCNAATGFSNPLFPNSPNGNNGTYFYVVGDNQNLGSTLNGQPALTCGDGPMIETKVLPNFGNTANWQVQGDCVVWLLEGWVVPL